MTKKQYLQLLGQSWYIRIKVPAALRDKAGRSHIRRALHTRDLDQANRLKWPVIAQVRAYLNSLHGGAPTPLYLDVAGSMSASPIAKLAPPADDYLGLRNASGLDQLVEEWTNTSSSKTVQFQRRQVYKELRQYLGGDRVPRIVTEAIAAAYVDERLLKSPDSSSTRRRKLSALASLWEWMSSRNYVPRKSNPWRGFRLPSNSKERTTPKKRPYTMPELVRLFSGNPTYPSLREVMVLGLFTGARIDEICSLCRNDITVEEDVAFVQIVRSKTEAGSRRISISHPLALKIIQKRMKRKAPATSQLFHELKGGGYDKKLSWHVGQAFRYHRNSRELTGATDFHSLRRTFITRLENLGIDQVHIARYVGHSLPTLAFRVYSGGATDATQAATGRAISYATEVEAAITEFIK